MSNLLKKILMDNKKIINEMTYGFSVGDMLYLSKEKLTE
jgi:hypothetical protein